MFDGAFWWHSHALIVVQPLSVVDNSDLSPTRLTFLFETPYSFFSEETCPFSLFQAQRMLHEQEAIMNNQNDIGAAQAFIRSRLDTLASITAANILIPGEPQERYPAMIEEAYAVLDLMETQLEALRMELEYHHKRLDEIRAARLSQDKEQKPWQP